MLRLKGCPRCKGDILIDRDHLSWYEQCLQCGYQRDFQVSEKTNDTGKKGVNKYSSREGLATKVAK